MKTEAFERDSATNEEYEIILTLSGTQKFVKFLKSLNVDESTSSNIYYHFLKYIQDCLIDKKEITEYQIPQYFLRNNEVHRLDISNDDYILIDELIKNF